MVSCSRVTLAAAYEAAVVSVGRVSGWVYRMVGRPEVVFLAKG